MNRKIFISDNKDIGSKCKHWAKNNLPSGFEITDSVEECNIFISILYDKILNKEFLQNKECYNFHPAILPNYAGVGTMTWSILNNEKYHGITLHKIDNQIDAGDIIDIIKFKIDEDETAYSLYKKTTTRMFDFFKKKFNNILTKNYKLTKQDFSNRKVYTYKDLDNLLNLSNYMRATYFPNKTTPYYYDKLNKKQKVRWEKK